MSLKQQILAVVDKAFRNPVFAGRVSKIAETVSRRVATEVMQPFVYYVQTTDATPTVLATIELEDFTGGWLEVFVLGIQSDGSKLYTDKYYVRYHRTITLSIVYESDWIEDDFPGLVVLVQDDGSENIEIEVTGLAATTIDWECRIIHHQIRATAP